MLEPLPTKEGIDWSPDWRYEQFLRARFLNLSTEWHKMLLWLTSNPHKRKTTRGMKSFVGKWLSKSGQIRPERPDNAAPQRYGLAPKPDLERGRVWIKAIRAQLAGREPGQEG